MTPVYNYSSTDSAQISPIAPDLPTTSSPRLAVSTDPAAEPVLRPTTPDATTASVSVPERVFVTYSPVLEGTQSEPWQAQGPPPDGVDTGIRPETPTPNTIPTPASGTAPSPNPSPTPVANPAPAPPPAAVTTAAGSDVKEGAALLNPAPSPAPAPNPTPDSIPVPTRVSIETPTTPNAEPTGNPWNVYSRPATGEGAGSAKATLAELRETIVAERPTPADTTQTAARTVPQANFDSSVWKLANRIVTSPRSPGTSPVTTETPSLRNAAAIQRPFLENSSADQSTSRALQAQPQESLQLEFQTREPVRQQVLTIQGNSSETETVAPTIESTPGTTQSDPKNSVLLPRVDPRGLTDALLQQARTGNGRGTVELKFALHPEELGPVQVRMESRDGRLRIRILAASPAAADAIGRDLPRLLDGLRGLGNDAPDVELDWKDDGPSDRRESNREPSNRSRNHRSHAERNLIDRERSQAEDVGANSGLNRVA